MYSALASSDFAKFVNSESVCVDYSATVMSSVNNELSSLINSLFLCFSLFVLSRTSNIVFDGSGNCKHSCLVSHLREEVLVIVPCR